MDDDFKTVIPMGIHGRTGKRFHEPIDVDALANTLRGTGASLSNAERESAKLFGTESYSLPFGTSPNDISAAGWGIVYAPNTPPEIRKALEPLVAYRKGEARRYFREIEYQPGETAGAFLKRHNVTWGTSLPHRLPFHLLLVGSPEDISFEFQFQLDLEYSVGRIHFDTAPAEHYATYARNVVEYESALTKPRRREVSFFAPEHSGDASTRSCRRYFINPLAQGDADAEMSILQRLNAQSVMISGADATRQRLHQVLSGGAAQSAILWTAGHGMAFDVTDPEQVALQGALLTSDWAGFDKIERMHYLAGADVDADMDVRGLVAFLFACFGAGTPRMDSYPSASGARNQIAERAFVGALPQAMLARGALGVIGHIDVSYGYSFRPRDVASPQLGPYNACLGHLLSGHCLGTATCDLSGRAAMLGAQVADALLPGASPPAAAEMAEIWCERNDARGYILLGDPAVKLRFD